MPCQASELEVSISRLKAWRAKADPYVPGWKEIA
jgi:hypothetical protein